MSVPASSRGAPSGAGLGAAKGDHVRFTASRCVVSRKRSWPTSSEEERSVAMAAVRAGWVSRRSDFSAPLSAERTRRAQACVGETR